MIKRLATFCALLSLTAAIGSAAPAFDRVFGSCMVLPCNQPITVSGTDAAPNSPVTVKFGSSSATAKPDSKGIWKVQLPAMKPNSKGQPLTVTQNNETTTLDDVLVGVVWVASGQSNMLFRLNQSATGGRDIPQANNENLRIFNNVPQVHTNASAYKEQDFEKLTIDNFYKGQWEKCSPESAAPCSAVAYYFANYLQQKLDMPVGIIHSSLGGSEMAAWIPTSIIKSVPFYRSCKGNNWLESPLISAWVRGRAKQNLGGELKSGSPNHPYKPGFLYDSGIEWITKMPVSGVIWYQGESDAEINNSVQNYALLKDLILSWRKEFANPELPFIMAELPRINDTGAIRAYWPEFRELQQQAAKTIPNVYNVNTIDLGSTNSDVHPNAKEPVGLRMANTALLHVYGKKDVAADGPVMNATKIVKDKILVSFKNAEDLKTTDGTSPAEFQIAGADGKFVPATATIEANGIVAVGAKGVNAPKFVRYCWATFVKPNLVNGADLPAAQFRTDTAKAAKK